MQSQIKRQIGEDHVLLKTGQNAAPIGGGMQRYSCTLSRSCKEYYIILYTVVVYRCTELNCFFASKSPQTLVQDSQLLGQLQPASEKSQAPPGNWLQKLMIQRHCITNVAVFKSIILVELEIRRSSFNLWHWQLWFRHVSFFSCISSWKIGSRTLFSDILSREVYARHHPSLRET